MCNNLESMAAACVRFFILQGRFTQRRQVCPHMGVVIVSQWHHSRRGIDSCAHTHVQLNVLAVTAHVSTQPKLACTHEISSKTAILSRMACAHWIYVCSEAPGHQLGFGCCQHKLHIWAWSKLLFTN